MSSEIVALDDPEWVQFVAGRDEATPFHHPAWASMLAECYAFRAFAVALRDGGRLVAGIPVVETRGLRSRRWLALPFTDACSPLGEPEAWGDVGEAVDAHRRAAGAASSEIRAAVESPGAETVPRAVIHTLALQPDAGAVRRTFNRSQVERGIVRAERDGVVVRRGTRAADLTEVFYALHLGTRRRQGVPIQPKRFFELLWERLLEPGLGHVLIAEHDGDPVAAAVFLGWNRHLIYKFGASDAARRSARPNHAVFWRAIEDACAAGYATLDFGRTETHNAGLRSFKDGWGTIERALVYTSYGGRAGGSRRPRSALSFLIRHSPPWVCRALGERLYRYAT